MQWAKRLSEETVRLSERASQLSSEGGAIKMLARAADKVKVYASFPMMKACFQGQEFEYLDAKIPFFIHHYNATWRNERAVEIAIANRFLQQLKSKYPDPQILELGNVMVYYDFASKIVVDKYEPRPGTIKEDFLTYSPETELDAFLSISTFEHIGWDETPRSPTKVLDCLNRIESMVKKKENVLVTICLGYNRFVDKIVAEKQFEFAHDTFYKRTSWNKWEQCDPNEAIKCKYDSNFPAANAIWVGQGLK